MDKTSIIEELNQKATIYSKGHTSSLGKDANITKNPIWKIEENGKTTLLMYCEKDTVCKLCPKSYEKILDFENKHGKKITWYKMSNGYICSSIKLFIHQIIMECYGNGKGTKMISIDHVDRDPLNNTFDNLRIATRKEQEQNSKGIINGTKKERKNVLNRYQNV